LSSEYDDVVLVNCDTVQTREWITSVSEKDVSVFEAKDGSVPNETKVARNRSAQFRLITVALQLFPVSLCV
jgi:hypothetical protein